MNRLNARAVATLGTGKYNDDECRLAVSRLIFRKL